MTTGVWLEEAQQALKAGEKQQARLLLQKAVREDAQNYLAWLWLASVTPSPQASMDYVRRAQALRPHEPTVQKALVWAEKRLREANPQPVEAKPITEETTTAVTPLPWRRVGQALLGVLVLAVVAAVALLSWQSLAQPTPTLVAQFSSARGTAVPPTRSLTAQTEPTFTATPQPTITPTLQPLHPKNVAASSDGSHEPRATWTLTPTPTPTETPTPTVYPTFLSPYNTEPARRPLGVGPNEHWVDVDLSDQILYAYEGDLLVYQTYISSGTWDHPTVTGQFRVYVRYESQTMDGRLLGYDYYLENVPYVMYFYQDYALHGTFWHNNFGYPMSHGCVNLKTSDAEWIFNWSTIGTLVDVHE